MVAMRRRDFVAALGGAAAAPAAAPTKPNMIFILADDLGYGDLGCYGQKQIATPNLDRMAAEGMKFSDAYAGSTVCAPSRCCLMTGLHTGHAKVRTNGAGPIGPGDLTVTEILKSAGYRTALYGKWSLGGIYTSGYPLDKGFDEWFGYFSQSHAHEYYPEILLDGRREVLIRGNFGEPTHKRSVYVHDLFTERALKFIEQNSRNPYFLHLCYTIPHANNELGRSTDNGMQVPSDAPYTNKDWPQTEKNFAAMITRMDAGVGRILAALKKSGQDKNTLVIFSSDNGPHREGGHNPEFFRSSGPLRGIKRDLYEGGIRVPFLAWWPGRIPPGSTNSQPVAFWDFLATAAELAGARVPVPTDGISIVPALMGRPLPEREFLYWEFHERRFTRAVRTGRWKGVMPGPDAKIELYDLQTDIAESRNVADAHPSLVEKMAHIMKTARTPGPEAGKKG
jgi:arylsulfatase A-like enzyme